MLRVAAMIALCSGTMSCANADDDDTCVPRCTGKCCGDDGCGNLCPNLCADDCDTQTCRCPGSGFPWPDGEPADDSLYFVPSCDTSCPTITMSRRDSASLTCRLDMGRLFLQADLSDTGSFELNFLQPTTAEHTFNPTDDNLQLDWTTEDGATWFTFIDGTSSGTFAFAVCGDSIAGRFEDAVEPHTFGAPQMWLLEIAGAFKCNLIGGPLPCGT